ncbi:MAG: hypothetical protein ABI211_19280, partial [Vicinamibacterales bacterium]
MQFVEWAHGAGVPAANIHLFLSTADHARFTNRLQAVEVSAQAATFVRLFEFREKELPKLSGDLLYFYWSGHGSVARNGTRLLFFEEQQRSVYTQFNLNDFLELLRSDAYGGFAVQVGYVDTCANSFEKLGLRGQPGRFEGAQGANRIKVRQMWLCAADSGQQAIAGAFSQTVLTELTQRWSPDTAWPIDHDAIVEAVTQAMIGDDVHPSIQRPVQLSWVTSTGSSEVYERGELPAEEFVNIVAAGWGLPVQALRRLAEIAADSPSLKDTARREELFQSVAAAAHYGSPFPRGSRAEILELDLLYIVASAFHWQSPTADTYEVLHRLDAEMSRDGAMAAIFSNELSRICVTAKVHDFLRQQPIEPYSVRQAYLETSDSLPPDPKRDEADRIVSMLDRVVQLPPRDDLPFYYLWEFLLRLGDHSPDARAGIETFVKAHATSQVALRMLRERMQRHRRYLLSICIAQLSSPERVPGLIEARLFVAHTMERVKLFDPVDANGSWVGARDAVAKIVESAREKVHARLLRNEQVADHMDVEFVLNHEFFPMAPDRVGVPLPVRLSPLGRLHPVVVRWVYRLRHRAKIDEEAWFAIAANINREAPPKVRWVGGIDDQVASHADQCDGLLALSFVPDTDAIADLLDAGFPFMTWPREAVQDRSWETFRQEVNAWATRTSKFCDLPRALRSIRETDTALGSHLTLLWDDPEYAHHWVEPGVIDE